MRKKTEYSLNEVFTPSQPAIYTYIERKSVNRLLDRAFNTPGKQIIIYGYSGAGKTTILTNKLRNNVIKSITTRCITGMTLFDIIIDAFNQLEVFYEDKRENVEIDKVGGSLSASYFGIKASLSSENHGTSKKTLKRIVDLPITPQTLAKFIGASGNCWIIEDFHKIDNNEKTQMAQIMKVFMDSSIDFPKLRIIAVGAVNSAREIIQYDPEMKNRISEIEVPLMTNLDLQSIIYTGQKLLNIKISDKIVNKIVAYSCGLAAVTHQLTYLLCEVNNIDKTHNSIKSFEISSSTFEEALDEYLEENSDSLRAIFESSTRVIQKRKLDNPIDIIRAIITINKESVTINDIIDYIKLIDKNYNGNNLEKHVDELTLPLRSEILRFNKESTSYYFSNPFIKAYFQCELRCESRNVRSNKLFTDYKKTLEKELEIARRIFLKDIGDNIEFEQFDEF